MIAGGRQVIPVSLLPTPRQAGERRQATFTPSGLPPPLSLYVHVPWCVRKCPYCDFNSHALAPGSSGQAAGSIPEDDYLRALLADLEAALPLIWGRRVGSVFIGGGTPSLLSAATIDALLAAVRSRLPLVPGAEITLEANPGTVEASKFAAFRQAGVTRLSLGVQSFHRQHLLALARVHDDQQAIRAVAAAAAAFANFNLDLMYGLPQQTLAEALADLRLALSFAPTHASCYQLTIEANTPFAAAPPRLPEADLCADMQEAIENELAGAGYEHYETSAFARPEQRCQHNLNYWQFGDYLGIGAGAHSKLTLPDGIVRQMRWKQPASYLRQVAAGTPLQEEFTVPASHLPFEFLLNALRLNDGFDLRLFESRTALPLRTIEGKLAAAVAEGLLVRDGLHVAPSRRGRRFLNRLLLRFLPEDG